MDVTIIGTGFMGATLGRSLAAAGHRVVYGSRRPDDDDLAGTGAAVAALGDALSQGEVVILAIPGSAVGELTKDHGDALAGRLVIDATNQMGADVANARASLPPSVRYARAFNTLGGENLADPMFDGVRADMFFSAPADDRATVETVIEGVGLRPVYVGEDQEAIIDALFQLWIALAMKQGRGRRLALHLLEG
ncbi:MAG TPA: NAD(P)-binding domain-containing protein [Acidimicrobiales bacterium]|nr:NAD(P)-binding domain-containing protein [Acidimicrobiales bacterium]